MYQIDAFNFPNESSDFPESGHKAVTIHNYFPPQHNHRNPAVIWPPNLSNVAKLALKQTALWNSTSDKLHAFAIVRFNCKYISKAKKYILRTLNLKS